jgi:hypothetical protein
MGMEKDTMIKVLLVIICLVAVLVMTGAGQELINPFKQGADLNSACALWISQECNPEKVPQGLKDAVKFVPDCAYSCGENDKLPCKCGNGNLQITQNSKEKYCCFSSGTAYEDKTKCSSECSGDGSLTPGGDEPQIANIYDYMYACCSAAIGNDILKTQLHDRCRYRC